MLLFLKKYFFFLSGVLAHFHFKACVASHRNVNRVLGTGNVRTVSMRACCVLTVWRREKKDRNRVVCEFILSSIAPITDEYLLSSLF